MPTPPSIPVIIGPTASGKSSLAVELALAIPARLGLPGEIVTADAFQAYRSLDIGTAKPTLAERRGVPHHLIDVREPTESFSVDQWLELAEQAIADIHARGALPIVVGGTHLYVKAFLHGLFDGPPADAALRAELGAMDPVERRAELERVDPVAAARIHPNDVRRTIRALEVHRLTGTPISAHQSQWGEGVQRSGTLIVALSWPVELINRRINARVKAMFDAGLVDEVRGLLAAGRLGPRPAKPWDTSSSPRSLTARRGTRANATSTRPSSRSRFRRDDSRRTNGRGSSSWVRLQGRSRST